MKSETKINGYKGIYEIIRLSDSKIFAEAKSNTGGKVSLTKNKNNGLIYISKGSKQLGVLR
jgi:hypothetical protein